MRRRCLIVALILATAPSPGEAATAPAGPKVAQTATDAEAARLRAAILAAPDDLPVSGRLVDVPTDLRRVLNWMPPPRGPDAASEAVMNYVADFDGAFALLAGGCRDRGEGYD